jgi:hypothetical protein
VGDGGAFLLGGGKAVAKALALGLADQDGVLRRRNMLLRRAAAWAEVLVEQIFGPRRHLVHQLFVA